MEPGIFDIGAVLEENRNEPTYEHPDVERTRIP